MSIHIGKKETILIYLGKRAIVAVYHGLRLVWQSVRSCFGSGWWIDEKPWLDDDGWKN